MLSTSRAAPAGRQRTISAQEAASGARRECRTFRRCTPPRDARFCRSTAVGLRVSDPIGIIIRTPHRRARAHNSAQHAPSHSPKPLSLPSLTLLPSGPARLSQHKSSAVGQMVNSALDNGCDWHHHRGAHGSQQQQEEEDEGGNKIKISGAFNALRAPCRTGMRQNHPVKPPSQQETKRHRISEREKERGAVRARPTESDANVADEMRSAGGAPSRPLSSRARQNIERIMVGSQILPYDENGSSRSAPRGTKEETTTKRTRQHRTPPRGAARAQLARTRGVEVVVTGPLRLKG